MAAKGAFNVAISVEDKTALGLKAVNNRLRELQRPAQAINKQMNTLKELTGVKKLTDQLGVLGNKVKTVGLAIGSVVGIGSLAGIAKLTSNWMEWGLSVTQTARWLGTTNQEVIRLNALANRTGAATDSFVKLKESFEDTAFALKTGRADSQTVSLWHQLGLNPNDPEGSLKKVQNRIRALYAEGRPDAGRSLAKDFGMSPDQMKYALSSDEDRAKFDRQAADDAEKLAKLSAEGEKANIAFRNLKQTFESKIGQALTPAAEKFTAWLSDDTNITRIMKAVDTLGDALKFAFDHAGLLLGILGAFKAIQIGSFFLEAGASILAFKSALTEAKVAAEALGAATRGVTAAKSGAEAAGAVAAGASAAGEGGLLSRGVGFIGRGLRFAGRATGVAGMADLAYETATNLPPALDWAAHKLVGPDDPTKAQKRGSAHDNQTERDQTDKRPIGIRNNNPGNIRYVGQKNATMGEGGFAKFETMDDGVAAIQKQIGLYSHRDGINSVSGIIGKWAPPNENNTASYIDSVAKSIGVDKNDKIDVDNPEIMGKLQKAIMNVEVGKKYAGGIDVNINHNNAPQGTTVSTKSSGNVNQANIIRSQPSFAA